MFAETWRKHWGLSEEPFAHEDADKDPILGRVEAACVHSSFDRIWGSPDTPGPGIVFGEKGSGKSGLRLAVERRIREHNEGHPDERILEVDYTDFDSFLEQFRRASKIHSDANKAAPQVASRFTLADHMDAVLSKGVTKLVDEINETKKKPKKISRQQKVELLTLASLYYQSDRQSPGEALGRLRHKLRFTGARRQMHDLGRMLLTILGIAALILPQLNKWGVLGEDVNVGPDGLWYGIGAALLVVVWSWTAIARSMIRKRANRATRSVRVLADDADPVVNVLESIKPNVRKELTLPSGADEATRYLSLQRFLSLLPDFGYRSVYVLMDRIDEATLFGGKEDYLRPFVERMLDHKLLQHPGLALKLFLPIELARMYLGASPEELKRMRLDKANTVQEMRWTGQELLEIANKRLAVSAGEGKRVTLESFLGEGLGIDELRDTLHELGTPRHAFGFLSALFGEYAKNLPEELAPDAPEWGVPRNHFEVVRASWGDRARVLRRAMN